MWTELKACCAPRLKWFFLVKAAKLKAVFFGAVLHSCTLNFSSDFKYVNSRKTKCNQVGRNLTAGFRTLSDGAVRLSGRRRKLTKRAQVTSREFVYLCVCGRSGGVHKRPWLNFRLVTLFNRWGQIPTEVVCVWMIVYILTDVCVIYICLWVSKYRERVQCHRGRSCRYLTLYTVALDECWCACLWTDSARTPGLSASPAFAVARKELVEQHL